MFERLGIDYVVECPFTQEIMCMEPEDFIAKIVRQLHVKCMVVGEDFHFGHNRRGDYHMLRQYAGKYGYEVIVVENDRDSDHQPAAAEGEAAAAERCLRDGGIHRRPVLPRHQQRGVQAYD